MAFWAGKYGWGDHFLIFFAPVGDVDYDAGEPDAGRKRFAGGLFKEYLGEFLPSAGVAIAMAMLWRLITYYPYLFAGVLIVPRWLAKAFRQEAGIGEGKCNIKMGR